VRGAAGWDGDKYQLVDVGRGEALSWLSVWDTSIDAAEFFSDLDIGVLKRYGGVTPKQASQELHVYRIRGRTLSIAIGDVNGRPVVLFSDVPDGVSAQLIDIGRVTLKE
jgi:hypothetical protein